MSSEPVAAEAPEAPETDAGPDAEPGPRTVSYPYKRIQRPKPTPSDGPDPYGDKDPDWLRIDWKPHLSWIDVGGTRVNYAEIGEGPAIVFVHGLGGCWQNWLENMPHFAAAGRRAIAMDLPGFGHSPLPEWEISMPAYGRLVDDFCHALGIESATLVGNSMGGFISAEVATFDPEWVDRLVLVSAAGISHATMRREPVMATARTMNVLNPLLLRMNDAGLRRPGMRQLAFQGLVRHPQRLRRELLYEFTVTGFSAEGYLPALNALTGYHFLDRLPEIKAPTMLIWGRDDRIVPASDAPGYEARIPDCELVVFDDCGHIPMAERPVRFNRLTEAFAGAR